MQKAWLTSWKAIVGFGVIAGIAGYFGWGPEMIRSQLIVLSRNWPTLLAVAGLIMTCIGLIKLNERLHAIPPQPASTIKKYPVSKAFYVGQINVNTSKLKEDLYIEVSVKAFNATGVKIKRSAVSGFIVYYDTPEMKKDEGISLPPPQIADGKLENDYDNLAEMFVVLSQRVPSGVASRLLARLNSGKRVALDFSNLNIPIVEEGEINPARLPLWPSVTLDQEGSTQTRMMITARINVVEGR